MSDVLLVVSIYFILIPTVACLPTLRHYRLSAIMFVLFMLSILTEQVMLHQRPLGEWIVFDLYCLAECAIFLWIVLSPDKTPTIRHLLTACLITLPVWLLFRFIIPSSELFNSIYQVCIAFLAARKLLKIIETTATPYDAPIFWITLGIFVYCFGTFFEMIFLQQELVASKIWYIHNIINIITYVIYTVGLVKSYTPKYTTKNTSPK